MLPIACDSKSHWQRIHSSTSASKWGSDDSTFPTPLQLQQKWNQNIRNSSLPRSYKWWSTRYRATHLHPTEALTKWPPNARTPQQGWNPMTTQKLTRLMIRMRSTISTFPSISHDVHHNSLLPWCQILYFHNLSHKSNNTALYHNATKMAQYHDATNTGFVFTFSTVFHMKFIKTVQYHGATNDMLYQLCDCTVFSMWFAKTAQYHDATNKSCCLLPSWYFPWISQIRLDTKMLQITSGIPFFFA